jgi:4-amino-4-deoxy-L-arabinose transferase-like glycosyltransferase
MNNYISETLFPFWVLAIGIVLAFTLPVLVQDAMFQDAMLYSSVSHNLAIGYGTFWFPQYSALNIAGIPSFHEQPPLVFGIQSLFYRALGDSIYVERFYTLLTLIIHIILINKLWKLIFSDNDPQRKLGFIAVFFWILIPVCWWCFHNNLMENTMSIFDLLAVIIIFNCLKNDSKNNYLWVIAGLMIFLASFSKGLPGLFPIVAPMIYWFVYRKISFSKGIYLTSLLFVIPAMIYTVLFMFPESNKSLSIYIFERLLVRVNSMPTSSYRLEIFWRLFTELIPVLIGIGIVYGIGYFKRTWLSFRENNKRIIFFLLVGLSASIPLALTMVQKGWYLVPSFPYFAISASLLISPFSSQSIRKINPAGKGFVFFRVAVIVFFIGVILVSASQVGRISREEKTLKDVYKIGEVVPVFSTVTVPANLYDEYDFILQGFLVRHFNISIDPHKSHRFFLNEQGNFAVIPPEYQKLELALEKYELYIRKD